MKNYLTLEEFEKELLKDDDDFKVVNILALRSPQFKA